MMQTKKDIEKWKSFLKAAQRIVSDYRECDSFSCTRCPVSSFNNGYERSCVDLGIRDGDHPRNQENPILLGICEKYLRGDITFLDGKLVEVED